MDRELEFKIELNKRKLIRLAKFNWKRYFLKTFGSLLVFFLIFIIIIPKNFFTLEPLKVMAIGLLIMLLVCAIVTPIMVYWIRSKYNQTRLILDELLLKKRKVKA